ncbi:MAG: hypothetical protein JW741_07910 [Sedimentisphaerales bacterium]|nr:hypothetical protein [Sedimentisphaerales bacterium]
MCGLTCLATIGLLVGMFALAPPAYDARSFAVAEAVASEPAPADGAGFVDPDVELSWSADANAVGYDVYFGTNEQAVTDGTGDTFQGRHETTTFDASPLGPLATYYWRIDEISVDGTTHAGPVWAFTTVDFIVIDDFESYTNEVGNRVFETWIDGVAGPPQPGRPPNGTGAMVGHDIWSPDSPHYQRTIMETGNVHGGSQAMPVYYENSCVPYRSETDRLWRTPQDWTAGGMNTVSLWFRGEAANSADPLYVALKDDDGWSGVVRHPDPNALLLDEWQQWQIRLTTFAFGPVDPTAVTQLFIGTGNRQEPKAGGEGIVTIDDIRLMRCAPLTEPNEPNFVVIDDFESYTNERGHRVFETWIDGCGTPDPCDPFFPFPWGSCSGMAVGHDIWTPGSPDGTIMETENVHGGNQAMPLYYSNDYSPYYSETHRRWDPPRDWTKCEADTLSLWFRGEPANGAEPFHIMPCDAAGRHRNRHHRRHHTDPLFRAAGPQRKLIPTSSRPSRRSSSLRSTNKIPRCPRSPLPNRMCRTVAMWFSGRGQGRFP